MASNESKRPPRKRSAKEAVEGFISDVVDALKDLVSPQPEPVLIPIRTRPRRY